MIQEIPCPLHDGLIMAQLTTQPMSVNYRDIDYMLTAYFYKCPECGEEFTTDEVDGETLGQIPNSIWSRELEKEKSKNKNKMKVKCINTGYLKQLDTSSSPGEKNDYKPSLVEGQEYEVLEVIKDGAGFEHYDVGLKSNLSYVRSIHTGENLDRGDEIHWCHPSRFEIVSE